MSSNRRWQTGQNEPTAFCSVFFVRFKFIEVSSCDSHQFCLGRGDDTSLPFNIAPANFLFASLSLETSDVSCWCFIVGSVEMVCRRSAMTTMCAQSRSIAVDIQDNRTLLRLRVFTRPRHLPHRPRPPSAAMTYLGQSYLGPVLLRPDQLRPGQRRPSFVLWCVWCGGVCAVCVFGVCVCVLCVCVCVWWCVCCVCV